MSTGVETELDRELEERLQRPWVVLLYNDDWHTFDEVILQVQKATGCSLSRAEQITQEAHNRGRAIAFEGSHLECEYVVAVLRQIELRAEIETA
jgi:ATP-dependent Clp protease adaptor protein ClpS